MARAEQPKGPIVDLEAESDGTDGDDEDETDEGEANGIQITTAEDAHEPSGFEDVDLSEIQNED